MGSHFEKLVFGDETMVSDSSTDAKFSRMSLAVAKDSGMYEVDMTMGDHYFWGKDEDCHIFSDTCDTVNVSEFCSQISAQACDDQHMYVTVCGDSSYTGTCKMNLNVKSCKVHHDSQNLFYYGPEALCLETTVIIYA